MTYQLCPSIIKGEYHKYINVKQLQLIKKNNKNNTL